MRSRTSLCQMMVTPPVGHARGCSVVKMAPHTHALGMSLVSSCSRGRVCPEMHSNQLSIILVRYTSYQPEDVGSTCWRLDRDSPVYFRVTKMIISVLR